MTSYGWKDSMASHYDDMSKSNLAKALKGLGQNDKGNVDELLARLKTVQVTVPDDPAGLTIPNLQFALLSLGQPIDGKKTELVERLNTVLGKDPVEVKLDPDIGSGTSGSGADDARSSNDSSENSGAGGDDRDDGAGGTNGGHSDNTSNDETENNSSKQGNITGSSIGTSGASSGGNDKIEASHNSDKKGATDDSNNNNSGTNIEEIRKAEASHSSGTNEHHSRPQVLQTTEDQNADLPEGANTQDRRSPSNFRSPSPLTDEEIRQNAARLERATTAILEAGPPLSAEKNPSITLADDPDNPGHEVKGTVLFRTMFRSQFLVTLPSLNPERPNAARGVLIRAGDYPMLDGNNSISVRKGTSKSWFKSSSKQGYKIVLTAATERMDYCIVLLGMVSGDGTASHKYNWEFFSKSVLDAQFGKKFMDESINLARAKVGQGDLTRPKKGENSFRVTPSSWVDDLED